MTNKEKAIEIRDKLGIYADAYYGALEMAEWKDEQMKEALNNILIECDACFDVQITNTLESIIKHQINLL